MSPLKDAINLLDRVRQGDMNAADSLEVLLQSHLSDPPEDKYGAVHLSKQEKRIMDRLFARPGQLVTREQMFNALYFDSPDDRGDPNVPGVQICRLRKKLAGTQYQIPLSKACAGGWRGLIAS